MTWHMSSGAPRATAPFGLSCTTARSVALTVCARFHAPRGPTGPTHQHIQAQFTLWHCSRNTTGSMRDRLHFTTYWAAFHSFDRYRPRKIVSTAHTPLGVRKGMTGRQCRITVRAGARARPGRGVSIKPPNGRTPSPRATRPLSPSLPRPLTP